MQLKTSCCNKAVIRKDLTRFAPVWGLYTLALLLGVFLMMDQRQPHRFAYALCNLHVAMALVNLCYAFLTAQLLFGDLYTSRSCYALHALPLRRETWFVSHVVSGLIMSLIPTFAMSLMGTLLAFGNPVERAWLLPWIGFGAANLQYLFFFGLAALCSFSAGNRLGMAVCYGVANFLAFGISSVVQVLYAPMLFGVVYPEQAFLPFAPLMQMVEDELVLIPDYTELLSAWFEADESYPLSLTFTLGEGWGYLALCAGAGVGLLAAALLLYRKRKLEVAGDLLAVKALEPVFQVMAALACAYGFQLVHDALTSVSGPYGNFNTTSSFLSGHGWFIFMAVGLVVGWFTAKMLLERSTRVFRKSSIPGIVTLAAVLALTFAGTAADPMGLETWLPDPGEVESIALGEDTYYSGVVLDGPGDMENLMALHELAFTDRVTGEDISEADRFNDRFCLKYTMKDGTVVRRRYFCWLDSPTGEAAKAFYTRPEIVFTGYDGEFDFSTLEYIGFQNENKDISFRDPADWDGLLAALRADCEAGNMAQGHMYHQNQGYFVDPRDERRYDGAVTIVMHADRDYLHLSVYPECANTLAWMEERDILGQMNYEIAQGDYFEYSERISNKYAASAQG